MEINAGNILIILVGIVLCFFGIYLKRVTQIIMGFAWGAVIAFLLISGLAVGGMLDDSNEAIAILIVLAVGIFDGSSGSKTGAAAGHGPGCAVEFF